MKIMNRNIDKIYNDQRISIRETSDVPDVLSWSCTRGTQTHYSARAAYIMNTTDLHMYNVQITRNKRQESTTNKQGNDNE